MPYGEKERPAVTEIKKLAQSAKALHDGLANVADIYEKLNLSDGIVRDISAWAEDVKQIHGFLLDAADDLVDTIELSRTIRLPKKWKEQYTRGMGDKGTPADLILQIMADGFVTRGRVERAGLDEADVEEAFSMLAEVGLISGVNFEEDEYDAGGSWDQWAPVFTDEGEKVHWAWNDPKYIFDYSL